MQKWALRFAILFFLVMVSWIALSVMEQQGARRCQQGAQVVLRIGDHEAFMLCHMLARL